VLAELMPDEPEVRGLLALMELQAARAAARTDADGNLVLLEDQDRLRWDRARVARGLAELERAGPRARPGAYQLQAAIAACHARAREAGATNWSAIVGFYDELLDLVPSPVVELNRAVAVSMASGPQAGLDLVDALTSVPALEQYHLLPSVRGDLLLKVGRADEARVEFERAAAMTRNGRERELLLERARVAGSAVPNA
jgi:predicted RNA polymerase sigma factor